MSNCCTFESHRGPSHQHHSLIILRNMIARWFWHIRIRRERKQRSKISPALIDDLGLTEQQTGTETAGFFWHV